VTQRLTDMEITRVSLVDKGANKKRFAVFKRDEEGPMAEAIAAALAAGAVEKKDEAERSSISSILRKAADILIGPRTPVVKVATFAEVIAGQELQSALYDSWYTLESSLWSAIYARDDAGADLSIDAKQALVAQNLDEFKTHLLAAMASGIEKSDGGPAEASTRHIAAIVAKVGKKISAARMERLVAAAEALNGVLSEVVAEEEVEKRADAQEELMSPEELTAAVAKANEPLVARLEALEKSTKTVAKSGEPEAEPEDELTLEGVAEAMVAGFEAINKRLDGAIPSVGVRKSLAGQDEGEPVKKRGTFAGILD
jgi:hypothetical protein